MNRELLPFIDVLFGHEGDFLAETDSATKPPSYEAETFGAMAARLTDIASGLKVIAMPIRSTPTANRNDWGAFAYAFRKVHSATTMQNLEVLDRVGSGDAFASGFIFGLLTGRELDWALSCGLAHGALVMTTPGDNSFATFAEVAGLMAGAGAQVRR